MSDFLFSDAELMARTFGVVLGAASCHGVVSHERVDTVAGKMKSVLTVVAGNDREARAAYREFSSAIVAGRRAASEGEIQDWAAENALRQIEDDLETASPILE
ncbi:MAG TPA: hypothetical protein VM782_16640 [Stellaceae bacterium]|nr:hypothetical protein [Stellaceae bacterium]